MSQRYPTGQPGKRELDLAATLGLQDSTGAPVVKKYRPGLSFGQVELLPLTTASGFVLQDPTTLLPLGFIRPLPPSSQELGVDRQLYAFSWPSASTRQRAKSPQLAASPGSLHDVIEQVLAHVERYPANLVADPRVWASGHLSGHASTCWHRVAGPGEPSFLTSVMATSSGYISMVDCSLPSLRRFTTITDAKNDAILRQFAICSAVLPTVLENYDRKMRLKAA